jgi:hypothetical protein
LFLLLILGTYLNLSRSGIVLIFSNLAIVSIFLIIYPKVLLINNVFLNYPAELLFSLILSLTLSNILKYLLEDRNKQVLSQALSEYISKDIANKILTDS